MHMTDLHETLHPGIRKTPFNLYTSCEKFQSGHIINNYATANQSTNPPIDPTDPSRPA